MYRVLVFGMTQNPGGIESVIMNYYRSINKEKFQFDFLCNFYDKAAYEDELNELGGTVYHIAARSENYFRYRKELNDFFRSAIGKYQAIWVNICSLANIDYLIMAKKYEIPRRIIHSHNSQNMDSRLRGILHGRNKKRVVRYATDFWSCSETAAEWFYQDEILRKVVIIRNAISVDRMAFDENKRTEYREKLNWSDKYIIGNVGRLHFQKNQKFLLEILKEVLAEVPEARLVMVGQGEDDEMLKSCADQMDVRDKVYFAGMQTDIPGWLSAFDLFLFPSKFEGLPVAALEAQANGVPVLASLNVIPEEAKVNENFMFYSLEQGAESWSRKVADMKENCNRINMKLVEKNFAGNGYDIKTEVEKLEALFMEG